MAKPLKELNTPALCFIVAFNGLFFFTVLNSDAIRLVGLRALADEASTLLPIGAAGIVATVLNAFPSADLKATLVFWRLKYALPGHRAFSVYLRKDTRIDVTRLLKTFKGTLPASPAEQNAAWYKLYKTVRDDPAVLTAHKTFLLLRDYTAVSVLLLIVFAPWALIAMPRKGVATTYLALMIGQYLLARQGAHNAGVRLVTNVLALKSVTATPKRA